MKTIFRHTINSMQQFICHELDCLLSDLCPVLIIYSMLSLQEFTSFQTDLTSAPDGYNSVRGVRSDDMQLSDFKVW